MTGPDDDRYLQSRMLAADPAASLPPTDPERVAQLLEAAMSTDTELTTTESRETGTHDRSPLTWLVAAAAVVLIAAAGAFALSNRGGTPAPTAQPSVTQLSVGAASAAKCLVPSVQLLQTQTVAFQGTVTALADGSITFSVTHWFKGGPTDMAKVIAPPSMLGQVVELTRLEVGGDYLVSAHDGQVSPCLTGPATGQLGSAYNQAYGG